MNNMQQMNNMNLNVVSVPGGAPNGPGAPQMVPNPGNMNAALPMQRGTEKTLLNTYIYEYFLKNEMFDCARSLLSEAEVSTIQGSSSRRQSPSRRQKHDADGNLLNGIDESMETDRKEDGEGVDRRADDLPLPKVPAECPGGSFLFDWWSLFWDIFGARTSKQGSIAAMTYLSSTQTAQRMRQEQQQRLMQMGQMGHLNPQQQAILAAGGQLPGQLMNAPGYPNQMMRMQNGGMNPEGGPQMDMSSLSKQQLVRQAMVNNTNRKSFPPSATPQQIAQLKTQQMMQQQMQRGQSSDSDINGPQRPQSPATGQTAPSPSKRMRVEGEFQPGNGRGQPQPMTTASQVQASQMLLQAGINPNQLTQQQFLQFQGSNPEVQQKSIQAYAQNLANHQRSQLPKGGMPSAQVGVSAAHGTPMMHQTSDGGPGGNMTDFYGSGAQPLARGMSGTGGNHALQDYQMQLMLLEQQNKKRLMMARAEQDQVQLRGNEQRPDGSVAFQGMSPNASRAAPSPQPSQKMERGTPKMGSAPVPGSPLPDGQLPGNRGSPAASIAAFNGQQNMPNGNMMRPPSSHPGFNGQIAPHLAEAAMNPTLRQQQQAGRGQQTPQMWQQHAGQQTPQAAQQQMAQLQQQHQQQQAQQAQQQQQGQAPQGPQPPQPPQNSQQNQPSQQPQQTGPQHQGGQTQPQSIGTPNQRSQNIPHQSMPPPSAPTAVNSGRPSSPQGSQPQPPTPTQSNKPNPRAKKDTKDTTRKRTKQKAVPPTTTAVAPNAATPSEPPTPTTPITPHPVNSFNAPNMQTKNQTAGFQNNSTAPPPQQPTPQPPPQQAPQIGDPPAFSTINEGEFNLEDFDPADTTILDNFDFDSFLNTDDGGSGSGLPFDTSMFIGDGGVETGPGDS